MADDWTSAKAVGGALSDLGLLSCYLPYTSRGPQKSTVI